MIFDDIYSMCLHYYFSTKSGDKLTETNTINGVNITFNVYKLPSNYTFSSNDQMNTLMNLCGAPGYGQVIIGDSITINSGVTLSPPNRCKGFYIFCRTLTNNGAISMTQRGSEDAGQNVYLWKNQYVPATGAAGAPSVTAYTTSYNWGSSGSSGSSRSTGGGGSGSTRSNSNGHTQTTGAGSAGTSWSGGLGGGGYCCPVSSGKGNDANTIMGRGGDGQALKNGTNGASCFGGGGATISSNWGWTSKEDANKTGGKKYPPRYVTVYWNATIGSAGMMTIFVNNIYNYGNIHSNGGNSANGYAYHTASGGGSGGGSINLFIKSTNSETGAIYVNGGTGYCYGGNGGAGSKTIQYVENLIIPKKIKLTILLEGPSGSFDQNFDTIAFIKNEEVSFDNIEQFNNILDNYEKMFNDPVKLYDRKSYECRDNYSNDIKITVKYYRRTFNVTVTNGFTSKNHYRWGEITKIYYKNSSNNPLVKFKNWKTDDVELLISISRICNFVMPLHNVSISAEFEDQDRFNSNIYKDMFEKEIFELYDRLNNKYLLDLLTQKNNTVFQINHNLNLYDLVYLNENGVYKKGLATEEKYQVLGIVSEIINENEFVLTLYGPIDYDYNFESDSGILYLSDSIEGAFCSYEDITTAFYTPIGYYKNNQIVINILDSSIGRELKLYQDELFKNITFNYITENDINDIVSEVISKENRVDEVEPETPDEPEEPEEG